MGNFSTPITKVTNSSGGGGGDTSDVVLFEELKLEIDEVGQDTFIVPEGYIDGRYFISRNGSLLSLEAGDYIAADGVTLVFALPMDSIDEEVIIFKFSQFLVASSYTIGQVNALLALKLSDAPSDGMQYVRKDGAWIGVEAGIEEAPIDGKQYAREDGAWVEVTPSSSVVFTKQYVSAEQTITAGGSLNLTHGLGETPALWVRYLVCKIAEGGYSVGDVVDVPTIAEGSSAVGSTVVPGPTTLFVRFGSAAPVYYLPNKGTGALFNITPANWRFVLRAWA